MHFDPHDHRSAGPAAPAVVNAIRALGLHEGILDADRRFVVGARQTAEGWEFALGNKLVPFDPRRHGGPEWLPDRWSFRPRLTP